MGGALLALATIAACAEPAEESTSPLSESFVVEASAKTRSELGVDVWGAEAKNGGEGEPTVTIVRGYDRERRKMFEYRQTSPGKGIFKATVKGRETEAAMVLREEDEARSVVEQNSFVDNDIARTVVTRISADFKNGQRKSGNVGLVANTATIHINTPLAGDTPANLTTGCVDILGGSVSDGSSTASQCASQPVSTTCLIPQADTSVECDASGTPVCPAGFVSQGITKYPSPVQGLELEALDCFRTDSVDYKQRGGTLGSGLCNPGPGDVKYENRSGTEDTTTRSTTVSEGFLTSSTESTTLEGGADITIKGVGASFKASHTTSSTEGRNLSFALDEGTAHKVSNTDVIGMSVPAGNRLEIWVVNDIVHYTRMTFQRSGSQGSWSKSTKSGVVTVPQYAAPELTKESCF